MNSLNTFPYSPPNVCRSLRIHPQSMSDLELDGRWVRQNPLPIDHPDKSRDLLSPHSASNDSNGELETIESRPNRAPGVRLWESYAKEVQTANGRAAYLCLWTVKHGNRALTCNYSSKKQLVKRHIETTHLKFKSVYTFHNYPITMLTMFQTFCV